MANTQLRVILDDNAGFIAFGGGQQWTLSTLPQWYQGTSNYPAFAQVSDAFGKMTMAFTGTSVAFIGNTPPQGLSQSATVSIDGEAASVFSYGSTKPPAYIQWYQSPTLSNERHTITVDRMDGTAIDIVLVTVGPNTPLGTNKVFVDNNDPAIQYSGSWAESADGFNAGTLPDGSPIGGSTQRTNAVGDTMTFRFTGTSISVYGIFSWANIGSISMTCTLDGVDATEFYPVTANSPQHVRGDLEASNFLFFNKDNLSAGAHTFVLKITGIENQIFALDYLVYSPSFSTFANMPNLTPVPPADTPSSGSNTSTTTPSGGSNSNTPSGGSSSPKPGDGSSSITTGGGTTLPVSPIPESVTTATVSGVVTIITEAASAQTAIGDNQGNTNKSSSPLGAIVGGIVGGLFVLIFAVFLFFYLRRRQSKGNAPLSAERRLMSHNDNNLPPQMTALSPGRSSFGNAALSADATPFLAPTTPMAFASISDLKRDRFENDNMRRGISPFSSDAESHMTSFDNSRRNTSVVGAPTIAQSSDTDELEYVGSDSVPPAYDTITGRSSLNPVRRQF